MKKPKTARWVGWTTGEVRDAMLWAMSATSYVTMVFLHGNAITKKRLLPNDRHIEILVRELPKKRRKNP